MIQDPPPTAKKKRKKQVRAKKVKKETPTIPLDKLKELVGEVDNLYKIEAKHVWNDHFRVNVWTKTYSEEYFCANYMIDKSYFVWYNEDVIVDQTIQPQPKEK